MGEGEGERGSESGRGSRIDSGRWRRREREREWERQREGEFKLCNLKSYPNPNFRLNSILAQPQNVRFSTLPTTVAINVDFLI